ncbi:uncharacterized protein LOC126410030 [Nymphaea colorata]|uniref:uncharacterized protein LOC126410030 n=1 Tax=Nymphaea colorata TaxID=210225 RepID=UPI00214ED02C|nr:uncharacterized protein LOC126410030 [Nymphaea colorata]
MIIKHGCDIKSGELDTSRYSSPMPVVGLYIALASVSCLLLTTIDMITGFKAIGKKPRQKFWFPCKWFGVNSATLTLLSAATKIPVDLNTAMPGLHHQLTKLSGTVMLSVATAFFLPSFGKMNVEDTLWNLASLLILVVTTAVNIIIQMGTGVVFAFLPEHVLVLGFMLFILMNVLITTLSSEGIKNALEESFEEVSKQFYSVIKRLEECKPSSVKEIEKGMDLCREGVRRRLYVKFTKYARDIEYVIIRSPHGSTVGILSILSALVLVEAELRALVMWQIEGGRSDKGRGGMQALLGLYLCRGDSDYKWSVWLVLASQTLFVILVTIPMLFRWFESIRFVRHPIGKMPKWSYLLTSESKMLKSSYKRVINIVCEFFAGGKETSRTSIGCFLSSIGMFILSLLLLASLLSRIVSRSSSILPCFIFWLFKKCGTGEIRETLAYVAVHVHNEEEDDFHDWLYRRHKNEVDKEMSLLPSPSTVTNPDPLGNQDGVSELKELLSNFTSDTNLIIPYPVRDLLLNIMDFKECNCANTLFSMAVLEEIRDVWKPGSGDDESMNRFVSCQRHLDGSLLRKIRGAEQLVRYIDQYGLGKSLASSATMDWHAPIYREYKDELNYFDQEKIVERYPPALYRFVARVLANVPHEEEVAQYIESQLCPQLVHLILSALTHIFIAVSRAISPSKGNGTFEDDIEKEKLASTMGVLHVFDQLKEPLFAMLAECYSSGCSLKELAISNERRTTCISLHPWEEHAFFTGPYSTPFPVLHD